MTIIVYKFAVVVEIGLEMTVLNISVNRIPARMVECVYRMVMATSASVLLVSQENSVTLQRREVRNYYNYAQTDYSCTLMYTSYYIDLLYLHVLIIISHSPFFTHTCAYAHNTMITIKGACCNNPCNNSGTCYNKVGGGYLCICPPGYYGANCDFDDNHLCISEGVENCFNHGFCEIIYQNRGPFPFCHCYEDYDPSSKCKFRSYRDNCKFDIPCNNGTCHYIEGGIYSCECPSGICEPETSMHA